MGIDYPPIRTFTEAVEEAFVMVERFRHVHTAVLLDDAGGVLDITAFTSRRRHTHETALDWASCAISNDDRIARMVLISTVKDPWEICERDIALFRVMRDVFGRRGVNVLDWIKVNRDGVRSMAMTAGVNTWEDLGPLGQLQAQDG